MEALIWETADELDQKLTKRPIYARREERVKLKLK